MILLERWHCTGQAMVSSKWHGLRCAVLWPDVTERAVWRSKIRCGVLGGGAFSVAFHDWKVTGVRGTPSPSSCWSLISHLIKGRWEGGSVWGIHVNPWLIHVNVWQKPLQYCKVISLQLIKKKKKKKKRHPENCLNTSVSTVLKTEN